MRHLPRAIHPDDWTYLPMPALHDDFIAPLAATWHRATPSGGTLDVADSVLRCALPPTPAGRYANAQIDDYGGARLARYPWRPPLRMEVRARTSLPSGPADESASRAASGGPADESAPTGVPTPSPPARAGDRADTAWASGSATPLPDSGRPPDAPTESSPRTPRASATSAPPLSAIPSPLLVPEGEVPQEFLRGTFGFGFWNAPMTVARGALRLPDAVWFFGASPPSDMRLVPGLPGCGWKAQMVHANRAAALLYGGAALGAAGWARLTGREHMASRLVRRMTGASEAALDLDTAVWHDYALEWHADAARFFVDGVEMLRAPNPPRGPLGFVAWIDNQYAVATPRGQLRFGTLSTAAQWLELDAVRIVPL